MCIRLRDFSVGHNAQMETQMKKKRTILIVDDNLINRELLRKILSREYTILEAQHGKEALEILEQKADIISAILLDLIMPVMNGYEFLEIQQKNPDYAKIPVIVTTQKEGDQSELETLSYGASDFLVKPYKPTIMLSRLANIIKLRETAAFANIVERDSLTGLYNKEAFFTKASSFIAENPDKKLDIICLDLESFKMVNDMYGEVVGDALLCYIAMQMNLKMAGMDVISCRANGDVFFIIMERREGFEKNLTQYAMEIINNYPLNMRVTVKFGVYQIQDDNLSVRAMCDRALWAVQTIKGKFESFCAVYNDSMREELLREQVITNEMESALEEGQFLLYFQPKVNLESGAIVGVEALVRWQHPEKGLLLPKDFVPIFEKNGFITELDHFVWETVCKQIKKWKEDGYTPVNISVNLSKVYIYNPNLPQLLLRLMERYEVEPRYLSLEITEATYTENARELIEQVSVLKKMGFSIVMDNFGKGYSSLSMLSEVPMDTMKLDMAILHNSSNKSRSESVISILFNLGKQLGLTVVAEGIETEEQVEFLKEIDCKIGQGFHFYKPMPQAEFSNLMIK